LVEKNPAFAKTEFLAAALTPVFIKKLSHHTSCIVSHHHKLWLDDSDNPQHVTALKANLSNLFNHKCGIHDACNPLYSLGILAWFSIVSRLVLPFSLHEQHRHLCSHASHSVSDRCVLVKSRRFHAEIAPKGAAWVQLGAFA